MKFPKIKLYLLFTFIILGGLFLFIQKTEAIECSVIAEGCRPYPPTEICTATVECTYSTYTCNRIQCSLGPSVCPNGGDKINCIFSFCNPVSTHPYTSGTCNPFCGDGINNQFSEQCDNGTVPYFPGGTNGVACTAPYGGFCNYCTISCSDVFVNGPRCGDSNIDTPQETCDDGNTITEQCLYGDTSCNVCNSSCQSVPGETNYCGDNIVYSSKETCDDGNTITEQCLYGDTSCNVCDLSCQSVPGETNYCGDSTINGTEACDDGNVAPNDGCSATCVVEAGYNCVGAGSNSCNPICGDSKVKDPEICDDGNINIGDGCSDNCQFEDGWACAGSGPGSCFTICGDGKKRGVEACDDGNTSSNDGCSSSCAIEIGYSCTNTDINTPSVCAQNCGNSALDAGEACDDGNTSSSDGCSSSCAIETGYQCSGIPSDCQPVCGDGIILMPEICDNNSQTCVINNYDGIQNCLSPANCYTFGACSTSLKCGDGLLNGNEVCDDGDTSNGNGCSSACQVESGWECSGAGPGSCIYKCGNGVLETNLGEICDSGQLNGQPNQCNSTCTGITNPVCGNGYVENNEACDDNNLSANDGCDNCVQDIHFSCTVGNPSICNPICGDLYLVPNLEECDDNNFLDQDGCSPFCIIENGWKCNNTTLPSICQPACSSPPEPKDICDPTENCSTCPTDCGICSIYNPPPATPHEDGIFNGMFDEIKLILSKPQTRINIPGLDFGEAKLKEPSPDKQTNVYDLNTPTRVKIANEIHTINVTLANDENIIFTIKSDPQTINLKTEASVDVALNDDGIIDTRFTYHGLEGGRPKITITKISEGANPITDGSKYIDSPFLGMYIAQMYQYLVIIISILAVIMIIVAGAQWTVSGGNSETIGKAKQRIIASITGLLLAVSSYTILYTINPNLVKFKSLRILYIEGKELILPENEGVEINDIPDNIIKPDWNHATFDCKRKEEYKNKGAGIVPKNSLKTYRGGDCPDGGLYTKNIAGIVIDEKMSEPICKVAKILKDKNYGIQITSSFRPFDSQVELWCGDGAIKYPNTAERKKYYAVPGYSNHGYGIAIDAHLTDKNGKRLYSLEDNQSKKQCEVKPEFVSTLANAFYEADSKFNRLETEIWHFEFDTKSSKVDKYSALPQKCNQ